MDQLSKNSEKKKKIRFSLNENFKFNQILYTKIDNISH